MITREVLISEYGNMIREIRFLELERQKLSPGSLQKKVINGKTYFYLATRQDGKVVTKYIKPEELDDTESEVFRRRIIESALKELKENVSLVENALGKKNASTEHIKLGVKKVIEENPDLGVEKVTLFGSRANGKFTRKSDVDLMVKFKNNSHVGLFEMSGFRLRLIDALGLDVDLIEESAKLLPGIIIGKTEVVYG